MKKIRRSFCKENKFSSCIFPYGVIGITVISGICFKKIMLGHFFWQDKLYNGSLFLYIYIVISLLDIWLVSKWCTNKSLLRMIITGLNPIGTVMTLRWCLSGFTMAKIILLFMIIYSVYIIYQIMIRFIKKKKIRIIGNGLNKLFAVLGAASVIGMAGYCLTGMDMVQVQPENSLATEDDSYIWEINRDILKLWKKDIYAGLSHQEKENLFQNTVIIDCQYWGIEPVKLQVKTFEPETVLGYYSEDDYTISIRKELLDMPREKVLNALLHETHHAYVHMAVESVDWTDKNVKKNKNLRFYKELLRYKQGMENYVSAEEDEESYYNNPLEVSAREYAQEWGPILLQMADSMTAVIK